MSYTRRTKSSLGRNGVRIEALLTESKHKWTYEKAEICCACLKTECFVRKEVREGGNKSAKNGLRKTDLGYTMNSSSKYTQIKLCLKGCVGFRNLSLF